MIFVHKIKNDNKKLKKVKKWNTLMHNQVIEFALYPKKRQGASPNFIQPYSTPLFCLLGM